MAVSIKELFTYKKDVEIKNRSGEKATIWVKLMGESDLNESYRLARVASSKKRELLRDPESVDYQDEIAPLSELTREELEQMILGAKKNRFIAESFVKVDREELPEIDEVSSTPDAPTLEEQEILDKKFEEQKDDYEKRLDQYVEDRLAEVIALLKEKTDEEVIKEAQDEMVNILPLQTFFFELNAQKGFRGTYEDKECKKRIFDNVDDYKSANDALKKQVLDAYTQLEIGADDIKN